MAYTFEFTADDGQKYEVVGKTHLYHLLEDEEKERILYSPFDPNYAVVYDTISGAPKFGDDGIMKQQPIYRVINLFVPIGSIILHGGWMYFRYFSGAYTGFLLRRSEEALVDSSLVSPPLSKQSLVICVLSESKMLQMIERKYIFALRTA